MFIHFIIFVCFAGAQGMSVKLQFDSPGKGGMVQRSCSFTGVNTLTSRHRYVLSVYTL